MKSAPVATTLSTRPPVATKLAVDAGRSRRGRGARPRQRPASARPVSGAAGVRRRRGSPRSRARRSRRRSSRNSGRARAPSAPVAAANSRPLSGVSSRGSTTCVSGSPKRALNSMTRMPCVGHDEPAVEQADEGRALARRAGARWAAAIVSMTSSTKLVGQPGQRRVGAHAAGVGAGVAVADALVVLRGAERHDGVAVAEQEERDLLAGEELLDEHAALLQVVLGVGDARRRDRR